MNEREPFSTEKLLEACEKLRRTYRRRDGLSYAEGARRIVEALKNAPTLEALYRWLDAKATDEDERTLREERIIIGGHITRKGETMLEMDRDSGGGRDRADSR